MIILDKKHINHKKDLFNKKIGTITVPDTLDKYFSVY
jgi:hypothetical protein